MTHEIKSPKKLIEVALPLDAINKASAREKSIRHGHPSTLHLWWARRPLAAARAVIFSQLVHDPEDLWYYQNPGKQPNKQVRGHWTKARARLFKITEDLVLWENTTNEEVLNVARAEIRNSWTETCELNKDHPQASELFDPQKMPGLHDPFAGGGTIPLEAQRLGLEAYASDLNPVAVLINKAMIEIPPKFAGMPPVNPESRADKQLVEREWKGAEGLAEDVRYYGKWMRDEAEKRIGHLYPKVEITDEMVEERPDLEPYRGKKLTVIAWLWARTVKSPNPAFSDVDVPLISSFVLSSKPKKEAYLIPIVDGNEYRFTVMNERAPKEASKGTSFGRQKGFRCLLSETPISYEYVRAEAMKCRLDQRLMAVVLEGSRERIFLPPTPEMQNPAKSAEPSWKPELKIPEQALGFRVQLYGMKTYGDLYTQRQLTALSAFADLTPELSRKVIEDAREADASSFLAELEEQSGTTYAQAICLYLAFALDRVAERHTTIAIWDSSPTKLQLSNTFRRQAIPMTWDFAEGNPFCMSSGTWTPSVEWVVRVIENLPANRPAFANQTDASTALALEGRFVSTDPPYYDNIGYADLSDFFYVWLRHSMKEYFPTLFSTIAVPKATELIAAPHRHGGKEQAESFFLEGMTNVMRSISGTASQSAPITIFYAFKQADTKEGETKSTGWDTFLESIHRAGLSLTGTWPIRTELTAHLKKNVNALASSIVMVCRMRSPLAVTVSRREFVRELNATLPFAIDAMTRESEDLPSPVAPVDLSQAVIGPGMAVFSKYSAVLEADGSPMTVRT